jgi:hypothetical protein
VSDLPILDELRGDLLAAMRAAEPRRRPVPRPLRSLLLAALAFLLLAATAAAATFYILRSSPIAPFAARDTVPEQRVEPGSSRVLDLRSDDPDAANPPWALRIARSQTGLLCGTVGQAHGGEFGIVGLDGRFRVLPEANADACGLEVAGEPALLGTRVFDADDVADVRTVVNGLAGTRLERVTIAVRGGRAETVEHSPEGAFLRAFAGFPEDLQPVVTLRFAGGRTRRIALADSPFVVPDPLGGRAWKVEVSSFGGDVRVERRRGRRVRLPRHSCVRFYTARYREATSAQSPMLCGHSRYGVGGPDRTLFYGARRLSGGRRRFTRGIMQGNWNGHASRTALWGAAGHDTVREIVVTGPAGLRRTARPEINGAFLVVLDPRVDPAALRVEIRYRDGRVLRTGPEHDLVDLGRTR